MPTLTKTKKTSRRKAANSPMPAGPVCGHSGCGGSCNVRYAGATTHVRDHYIHQAAQGMKHVWTAAIVAGFAVVVTGSIAYTAAQAETAPRVKNLNEAVAAIYRKLDKIEQLIAKTHAQGGSQSATGTPRMVPQQNQQQGQKPQLSEEAKACIAACQTAWKSCQGSASDEAAKETCNSTGLTCLKACVPSGAPVPPLTPPQPGGQQEPSQQTGNQQPQ